MALTTKDSSWGQYTLPEGFRPTPWPPAPSPPSHVPPGFTINGQYVNPLSTGSLDQWMLPQDYYRYLGEPPPEPVSPQTIAPYTIPAGSVEVASIDPAFFAQRGAQSSLDFKDLNSEFATRAQAAIAAAEAATGQKAVINSGYRSYDQQAKLYADYQAGRGGLAAAPGHSYHEQGNAVDVAPGPVLDWLHKHGAEYGVEFLQGSAFKADPVHMQMSSGPAPALGNTQVASVTPPLPNLRETALAFQGANPYDAAPPFQPPSPTLAAFVQPPGSTSAPPQAPTQTASSWLPPSLQPGGSGFVDNLGGGMSPLHRVTMLGHGTKEGFAPSESATIPPGPYGADALLRAAQSGDPAAVRAAMDALTKSAQQAGLMMALPPLLGGKGLGADGAQAAITKQLTDYLNSLPATAPGALRAVQTALQTNPGLRGILDPAQLKGLDATFAQLPPLPTGSVPFPNLRPPMPQGTPASPPLVAGQTPDPLAPKMASFAPPPASAYAASSGDNALQRALDAVVANKGPQAGWNPATLAVLNHSANQVDALNGAAGSRGTLGASPSEPFGSVPFAPGDNLDVRTDGEGNASPISYQKPAPDAAGLAQLLGRGTAQGSSPQALSPADQTAMQGQAGMPSPSAADAGLDRSPRQYWSPPVLNPTQMRGLEGPTGQGKINYAPLMAPGMPNFGLPPPPFDPNAYDPLADASIFNKMLPGQPKATAFGAPLLPAPPKTVQIGALPKPQPVSAAPFGVPPPTALSPQDAFQAQYGPAPQNVDWQKTLAPDPFSQAAPGTYVLQDFGSHGPPQNALQEAASQQGDSYLQYPDFSFGY